MIERNENPKRRRRRTKQKPTIVRKNNQEDEVNRTLMYNRKWLPKFFLLILIFTDLISTMVTASTSSPPSSIELCSLFKNNYSFDFAFNQIIRFELNKDPTFHHYLYSQMHFFQLKSSANNRMDVIPFEYETDPDLDDFNGDWGFSLPPTDNQRLRTSKICAGKIHRKHLTCVDMEYRQNATTSAMYGLMKNLERFSLDFPDGFNPSVAITPIEYYAFESSRSLVIFLEQNIDNTSLDTPSDAEQTTIPFLFQRKWRVYSMAKLDRIIDLTYSTVIPDYLYMVPKHLEITGIFGWKRSDKGNDEHMILVFNGSHHLYCLGDSGSNKCSQMEYYQTFLEECNAVNQNRSSKLLTVTRCCGNWEMYDKIYNSNNDDDGRLTVHNGRLYRLKSTNLFYVLWSLAILSILILVLLIFWLKSCISEARHDNEMMKIRAVQQQQQHNSPQPSPPPSPPSLSQGQHQKWKQNTKIELPPLSRKPQKQQDKTIVDDHVDEDDIIDVDDVGQDVEKIKMIDSAKTTNAIVHHRPYPNSNHHVDAKVSAQQPSLPLTKTTKFIEHKPNIDNINQYEHRPNQRLIKLP